MVESSGANGEATTVVAGSSGGGSGGEQSKLEEMQPGSGRHAYLVGLRARGCTSSASVQTDRLWTAGRETFSRDSDGFAWRKCNYDSRTRVARPTLCGYGHVDLSVFWSKMTAER